MATITDAGLEAVAKMIMGYSTISAFKYIATGTSATAEDETHTALGSENTTYGAQRTLASLGYPGAGISQWSVLFVFTGSVAIRELGLFNASSAGTMYMRHLLSENKYYSDTESVEITILNYSVRVT